MSLTWNAGAAALALVMASVGQARAAHTDLALTGTVGNGQALVQVIGNTRYDQWFLQLDGLDANAAFSVSQGDSITATITLDQSLTVPASVDFTTLLLIFQGTGFAGDSVASSGSLDLSNLGSLVVNRVQSASSSGQLPAGTGFGPPDNTAITFDSMVWTLSIDTLSQPANLDHALFYYTLFSPAVPEPATYALMLLGVGALGGLAKRRQARRG